MAGANTPRMGEHQRLRLRLHPMNAAGGPVADQPGSQTVLDLSGHSIKASVIVGGTFAELRNPDGSRLAPGGEITPSRYGECWLVGLPVTGEREVRVRMEIRGPRVAEGATLVAEQAVIVTDTVQQPVDPDPEPGAEAIASVRVSVSGPVDVPPGWLKP